jgi:hypothetical protein
MPKGPPGQQARAYLAVAGAPSDAGSGEPAVSEDAGPTPNCKPPFYYDSQWNRVFKRECLQ